MNDNLPTISFPHHLWRVFVKGLGFVLFGVGGLLGQLLMLMVLWRYPKGQPRHFAARRMNAIMWRIFLKYLYLVRIIRFDIDGLERMGKAGQLVLANHPSLLDVIILLSAMPQANCIVKNSLQKNPFMRLIIHFTGFIPNDDNEATLEAATTALKNGETLLIFPEGTRTGYDGVIQFNRMAVSIGLRAATEILPIAIRMQPLGMKKYDPWYRVPPVPYHYHITVGQGIFPAQRLAEKPLPVAARKLNAEIIEFLQKETSNELKNPN